MENPAEQESQRPRKELLTPEQALQIAIDSINEVANQRITSLAGFAQLLVGDDPRFASKRETARTVVAEESLVVGQILHTIVEGLTNVREKKSTWVKELPNGVTVFTSNPDPRVK